MPAKNVFHVVAIRKAGNMRVLITVRAYVLGKRRAAEDSSSLGKNIPI